MSFQPATAEDRAERAQRVFPFLLVIATAFPLALIGTLAKTDLLFVAAAGLGFVAIVGAIIMVPWQQPPVGFTIFVVSVFCTSVALLREAGGGAMGGYGALLILPTVWSAIYAERRDVAISIGASVVTLAAPILITGDPKYPVTEWRQVVLSSLTFLLTGVVVNGLMTRISRQNMVMEDALGISREAANQGDLCLQVCVAALRTMGADSVVLIEYADETKARVTAAVGIEVPLGDIAADLMPPSLREALSTGESNFSADLVRQHTPDSELAKKLHVGAVLNQVVRRDDQTLAVISLAWTKPRPDLAPEARLSLEVIASEAAIALERIELLAQLERMARFDELTGLLNRRAWNELLNTEVVSYRRRHRPGVVAMIDMDHFKRFNDKYGHLAGDRLLVEATQCWSETLRPSDTLARWGGEEFVIHLPGMELAEAADVVDRLRAQTPLGQTFSAGLVAFDGSDPALLLSRVDRALYAAKDGGRNCSVLAPPLDHPSFSVEHFELPLSALGD